MGSVCFVAAKDRDIPSGPESGALHNLVCSPRWSFRWDNRRRVADEIKDLPYHNSNVGNRGISMAEMSSGLAIAASQKSANSEIGTTSMVSPHILGRSLTILSPSDGSLASPVRVEVKNLVNSPDIVSAASPKHSSSTSANDFPSAYTHSLPPRSTPSRGDRDAPGQQLFRQVSDNQTLGLKSPSHYSTSEGRSPVVLSTYGNDSATGSHNASSEGGWSLNAFFDLVAQSQTERWSFDSEHLGYGRRRLSECSSRFLSSPSVDQQACGNCSKLVTERSSTARYDFPVAAVLACGHVFHAECLESMTSETDKYDPTCPICTMGETQVTKLSRKALKAEAELKAKRYKRCKNRVVDSYVHSECENPAFQKIRKPEEKGLKIDPSSSTKGSLSKSLMKWHFGSISSKWSKSSDRDPTSQKGFWSRHSNKRPSHSSSSNEGLNQTT